MAPSRYDESSNPISAPGRGNIQTLGLRSLGLHCGGLSRSTICNRYRTSLGLTCPDRVLLERDSRLVGRTMSHAATGNTVVTNGPLGSGARNQLGSPEGGNHNEILTFPMFRGLFAPRVPGREQRGRSGQPEQSPMLNPQTSPSESSPGRGSACGAFRRALAVTALFFALTACDSHSDTSPPPPPGDGGAGCNRNWNEQNWNAFNWC